jgi:tetratricopeptide (TPR) repeat protein
MSSRVLWEIDNETSGRDFERLCIDLLHRNGYLDIIPIEPQDHGRDAEETPRPGRSGEGHPAYFQFSMEKDWKAKLRRDAKTLELRKTEFDIFVFVTSQTARGIDTDALRSEFLQQYGWDLVVYGREWLRFQLEEKHPDLALRHLGVEIAHHFKESAVVFAPNATVNEQLASAKSAVDAGEFDLGIAQLKRFLAHQPESYTARQLLAWSYYRQDRFDEALAEINRARRLKEDEQSAGIKACILAEKGIKEHDKVSLLGALELFKASLDRPIPHTWHIFYNIGNVLAALHQYDEAIKHYRIGIELDQKQPTLWKNLATALHEAGKHDEEMPCFDKALELDPQQPEALVSKAVSLLMDFGKADEAAPLFQLAMRLSPDTVAKWPHVLYWYAVAREKQGKLDEALFLIEESLEQQPGDRASRYLKSRILGKLLERDPSFQQRAYGFWLAELSIEPLNFDARRELVRFYAKSDPLETWKLVDESISIFDIGPTVTLEPLGFEPIVVMEALRHLPQYRLLRQIQPLSNYWDPTDPMNYADLDYPENKELEACLRTYLAIAFGRAYQGFSDAPEAKSDPAMLATLFDDLRADILKTVADAGRCMSAEIAVLKQRDVKKMSTAIVNALFFLNTVALREFGAQRGFLMNEFEIEDAVKEKTMDNYDEDQLNRDIIGAIITAINDGTGIFPS